MKTSLRPDLDPVTLEIAWGRIQAVIDEAEATLIRASFSPLIREAYDFGVVLLDGVGGSVAQSQRSMPSFVGTLPRTLRAGLERFPASSWEPGDVFATNDPWLGTGHLPDMTTVRPIFRGGKPIAYAGCIAHWADIGGAIWSADTTEIFEEGLRLPPCKLVSGGRLNDDIVSIILGNVRLPEQVLGDLHAQLAAMDVTERRLVELLDDMGLDDPAALFAAIQERTETAMRAAIAEIPDGDYVHEIEIDGVREPLILRAALHVGRDEIDVDWAGTSPQVDRAINETYNHAYAMTVYPIKCALSPEMANNEGAYRPIRMSAPPGSLVNARYPAAVASRQMIGHYIAAVVFGALADVVPERVLADSGSPAPRVVFSGMRPDGGKYGAALTLSGGMGAQLRRDGLAAAPFPSNAGGTSAEIVEASTPLLFRRRALRPDSGGRGRHRGGLGVELDIQLLGPGPCTVSMMTDRVRHPPLGRHGGAPGAPNVITTDDGHAVDPKARTELRPGQTLQIRTAGGGGFGPPHERDPDLADRDLRFGYVTPSRGILMRSLGIDVGGTFTDFFEAGADGSVRVHKRLTTPDDPSVAVLDGIAALDGPNGRARTLRRVIHGTTLVANSLIQRRGARTALITTAGFRDTLEIGRESRYDLYDLGLERPEPLVERPLRLEVGARMLADGSTLEPVSDDEVESIVETLRGERVESVAVCLLNSYANPAHERHVGAALAARAPEIDVTLSSDVAPEWREYERTSTAAANAFVRPLVRRYLERLEERVDRDAGEAKLHVLLSQGGMASAQVAAERAVQLVESGPAGGVMAAAYFGRRLGIDDLLSFDMGGTTTKVSLVEGGEPLRVAELEVARVARFKRGSGLPLQIPAVELVEIGAGGGSIGRVDRLGLLKVGPHSAGADPGPACYGRGGAQPTVTDADLVLGLLDPEYFLGGEMRLDPERARDALALVGSRLELDGEGCARGIFDVVNSQMALALHTHVVERGRDPRAFALVAFGGAGPVHAYEVARRLGIRTIVCPPAAGVASAVGFLVSPFAVDLVRTFPSPLHTVDWDAVGGLYAEMEREARDLLARSGADLANASVERRVDMRYTGQGYTVPVRLPPGEPGPATTDALRHAYDAEYERRFRSLLRTADVEALHWRLTASVPVESEAFAFTGSGTGDGRKGEREAYFPEAGAFLACTVHDRYALTAGTVIKGPALVEERESTVVVGPSATVGADELGNLLIEVRPGA